MIGIQGLTKVFILRHYKDDNEESGPKWVSLSASQDVELDLSAHQLPFERQTIQSCLQFADQNINNH